MSGRSIPTIWGFTGIGLLPTFYFYGQFWNCHGASGYVLADCYNEHMLRLKLQWKLTGLPS